MIYAIINIENGVRLGGLYRICLFDLEAGKDK